MYCYKCGKELPDSSRFCSYCGSKLDYNNTGINANGGAQQFQPSAPNNSYEPKKEKHTFRNTVLILILVGLLGAIGYFSIVDNGGMQVFTKQSSTPSPKPTTYQIPLNEQPVFNGQIVITPTYERTCPFSVSVRGDDTYYIYLKYNKAPSYSTESRKLTMGTPVTDISFLVKPNSTAKVDVPIGVYKLYYCCGETWYGTKYKFGDSTRYSTSDELLSFYADSEYYQGHSLELWAQTDGNFEDHSIDESQFPG